MNPIAFRPWIALAFTGLALAALWVPLADPDIWWHLEAGREMVARGGLIRTDPFCHSSLGREWIDLHWIFQLVVYGLWKLGGPWAITLAKTVSLAGALVVLVWKRKRSFEPFGWLAAALAVLLFRESVDARPLVATLFVLALQWRLLDAEPGKSLGPMAFLAVGLQVLMANLQGLSWLGPITALGVMLPDAWSKPPDLWRRGGILGGMCLACLVTPWPLAGARLPFELFARFLPGSNPFHLAVSENVPLFSMIHTRPGLVWGTLWMGLAALVAQEISGRWRPSNLALFGATGGLAMLAVRNVPIACLGCVFVIARESPRIWAILQRKGRVFRRHSLAVHLGLAAMIGLLAIPSLEERRWDLPGDGIAPVIFPRATLRALAQQPKGAFIFHPLEWGGWLGWNLGASRCESDTRLVLQGPEFLSRHVSILDHPAIWAETTSTQIAWLPIAHALRYRPLLVSLLSSSSWRLVHFDGVSAILVRDPVVWSLQPDTLPGASLGEETGGNVRLRQKVTQEASEVLFQSRRFLAALAWDQDALK